MEANMFSESTVDNIVGIFDSPVLQVHQSLPLSDSETFESSMPFDVTKTSFPAEQKTVPMIQNKTLTYQKESYKNFQEIPEAHKSRKLISKVSANKNIESRVKQMYFVEEKTLVAIREEIQKVCGSETISKKSVNELIEIWGFPKRSREKRLEIASKALKKHWEDGTFSASKIQRTYQLNKKEILGLHSNGQTFEQIKHTTGAHYFKTRKIIMDAAGKPEDMNRPRRKKVYVESIIDKLVENGFTKEYLYNLHVVERNSNRVAIEEINAFMGEEIMTIHCFRELLKIWDIPKKAPIEKTPEGHYHRNHVPAKREKKNSSIVPVDELVKRLKKNGYDRDMISKMYVDDELPYTVICNKINKDLGVNLFYPDRIQRVIKSFGISLRSKEDAMRIKGVGRRMAGVCYQIKNENC